MGWHSEQEVGPVFGIGVLDVQSDRLNAFDESDVVVLQSLADQASRSKRQ